MLPSAIGTSAAYTAMAHLAYGAAGPRLVPHAGDVAASTPVLHAAGTHSAPRCQLCAALAAAGRPCGASGIAGCVLLGLGAGGGRLRPAHGLPSPLAVVLRPALLRG